jgi:hypothetical protein
MIPVPPLFGLTSQINWRETLEMNTLLIEQEGVFSILGIALGVSFRQNLSLYKLTLHGESNG